MNAATRVARPPESALLIFDGDCAFCRRWIARWKRTTGDAVDYAPFQSADIAAKFPEIPRAQLESAVHLIEPDGRVTRAAEAVFRSLAVSHPWPLRLYKNLPGFSAITELLYRIVAANRSLASWVTDRLWGRRVE